MQIVPPKFPRNDAKRQNKPRDDLRSGVRRTNAGTLKDEPVQPPFMTSQIFETFDRGGSQKAVYLVEFPFPYEEVSKAERDRQQPSERVQNP